MLLITIFLKDLEDHSLNIIDYTIESILYVFYMYIENEKEMRIEGEHERFLIVDRIFKNLIPKT